MKKWKGFSNLISVKAFLSVVVITAAIVGSVFVAQNVITKNGSTDIVGSNALREKQEENGSKAIVSAEISGRTTGTAGFDSTSGPGNDVSESDDIVRSFDTATWYITPNISLKDPNDSISSLSDGVILQFEAEVDIPSQYQNIENIVVWDTENMQWLENTEITNGGRKITGEYLLTFTGGEISAANRNIPFRLKVNGAANNMTIIPKFSVKLAGGTNTVEDIGYSSSLGITNRAITVSAKPAYNVKLSDPNNLRKGVSVSDGSNTYSGRACGFSFNLQLDPSGSTAVSNKGIKGMEIPRGNITFDIDLKFTKSSGSSLEEDISSGNIVLWNYKVSKEGIDDGNISGRTMALSDDRYTTFDYITAPYGIKSSDRLKSVYNSGNIQMVQNGTKLRVTVSDYSFDGLFPTYNFSGNTADAPTYPVEGCFSIGYFQIIVLDRAYDKNSTNSYKLYVTDSNFSATSLSGQTVTSQVKLNDDECQRNDIAGVQGDFWHDVTIHDSESKIMTGNYWKGNNVAYKNQEITAWCNLQIGKNNDDEDIPRSVDKLIKFDANAVEPNQYNGKWYELKYVNDWSPWETELVEKSFAGELTQKHWFVTKADGTNWSSETEKNNTGIESLNLYDNYSSIPSGYKCVGEYFELDISGGGFQPRDYQLLLNLKVKDTANLNQTYSILQSEKLFYQKLNRNTYSQKIKDGYSAYPQKLYELGPEFNSNEYYRKTEYTQQGAIMENTHNGSDHYGNTFLIVQGEQSIEISAEKNYYNLDNNDTTVKFKVWPYLETSTGTGSITGITEQITCTLPKGLKYSSNSTTNYGTYGEPQITNNSDGTQTLIWFIENCTTNQPIEMLEFDAIIAEPTASDAEYKTKAVISEYVPTGRTNKLGITDIDKRTDEEIIRAESLSGHTLYKGTSTSVIDLGDEIHYQIIAQNTQDVNNNAFQLLDVLPYDNDGRGTVMHGSYKVRDITIKAYDMNTGNEKSASSLALYTTNNTSITADTDAKGINVNQASVWTRESGFGNLNKTIRAFAVKGTLEKKTKIDIQMHLVPTGNKSSDIYKNNVTAQTSTSLAVLKTPNIPVTGKNRVIAGTVWRDNNKNGIMDADEPKIQNATLKLLDDAGRQVTDDYGNALTTKSDENGNYIFEELKRSNYIVEISYEVSGGTVELTNKNVGTDEKVNSKFDKSTKRTDVITNLNQTGETEYRVEYQNAGIIYKESVKRSISGTVWEDKNKNGLMDTDEQKLQDIEIMLYKDEELIEITTTNFNGNYNFNSLEKGTYTLEIIYDDDGVTRLTNTNVGTNPQINSKFNPSTNKTNLITELDQEGETEYKVEYQNAGLIHEDDNTTVVDIENEADRKITGTVWLDSNKDGIMNEDENVIQGVLLKLLNENGVAVLDNAGNPITAKTDAEGKYTFNDLNNVNYIVEIEFNNQGEIVKLTQMNAGSDITKNSKFNQTNNRTNIITDLNRTDRQIHEVEHQNAGLIYDISQNENISDVEIENIANRTITGTVWLDSNKDGIMNEGENVIQGVLLKLLNENGVAVLDNAGNPITTKTDAEGKYTFKNLNNVNYIVEIEFNNQGGIVKLTQMNAGSDITKNSKFNQTNNRTNIITDLSRTDRQIHEVEHQNAGLIYDISQNENISDVEIENIANRTITGTVWLDSNKDGIMNEDENVIQDVLLKLLNENGVAVLDNAGNPITAKTDAEGNYKFDNLEKVNYIVEIEFNNQNGIAKLTQKNAGSDITKNSKFDRSNNRTDVITDLSRTDRQINEVEHQNAGIIYDIIFHDNTEELEIENIANRSISGTVWLDLNENGLMEPGEDLLKDAVIKLLDEDGNPVLDESGNQISAITDAFGEYTIKNLDNKNYILELEYDGGEGDITLTQKGIGTDISVNSKFNQDTIRTDLITDFTRPGDEVIFDVGYQNAGLIYVLPLQNDNKVEVEFENNPLTYIEIIKTDSKSGDPLKDAKFGIYSEDAMTEAGTLEEGHRVATLTTGDDGRVKSDGLAPGIYYIQELDAPNGYIKSDEIKKVEITEAGQVIQATFTNDPIGYIRIKKEDSTLGTPLKGAKFGIYLDKEATRRLELDEDLITNDDGYTELIELAPGTYYVKEEVAPEGYRLNTDVVEVIIDKKIPESNPIEIIISDIQLGVENKAAEMYITVRKAVSDETEANQMNIEGLAEVLVYSNSVGRRDTNSVPGNALEIATNKGAWLAGHNSIVAGTEVGYAPPKWATVENDAYATESVVVIPPLGVPLRDYKKDETMYIVVCSITILAMIGLFSYKQVLINRTYVKIKKKEEEAEKR